MTSSQSMWNRSTIESSSPKTHRCLNGSRPSAARSRTVTEPPPPLARETNTRKILKRAGHRLSPSRLVITSPFSCLLNNFWVLIFAFATQHELVPWSLGLVQRLNFVYFVHKSFGRNLGSSHA